MNKIVTILVMSWIFLPSKYSNKDPVVPQVEALPDRWAGSRVYIWNDYREPGYYRAIRRSYHLW